MIKDLVEYVVKQFVNNPDDVHVLVTDADKNITVEISVNEADRGKVIGREGQTIKAIRMLVNAINSADKQLSVDLAKN